jgi:hypothetical protein
MMPVPTVVLLMLLVVLVVLVVLLMLLVVLVVLVLMPVARPLATTPPMERRLVRRGPNRRRCPSRSS